MVVNQRLMKCAGVVSLSLFLLLTFSSLAYLHPSAAVTEPVSAADQAGNMNMAETILPKHIHALNPDPPVSPVKLVFIHHSCGDNWLSTYSGALGNVLGANNYFVSDTYYDWGPDSIGSRTDIGNWWDWFRGENSSTYLSALYNTTNRHASYTRPMADPLGENEVIMFKSCWPNSSLKGQPDEPPTVGDNPLRGLSASSQYHTVGNAKGIYNDILEYFQTRQDKLFVAVTAPPVQDTTYAANARAFNNWLVYDWLDNYPYHNVAVFDFFNVLTTNGGNADTNDYGWTTGNHHRLVTDTTPVQIEHIYDGDDDVNPHNLEYPTQGGTNLHPSPAGNQKATGEFVPLLNVYYNCYKYGQCLGDASGWISITVENPSKNVLSGGVVTYNLSMTASAGFSDSVALTLESSSEDMSHSFGTNYAVPPFTSDLVVTTSSSTPSGTIQMMVFADAGGLQETVSLTLTVNPDMSLTAHPGAFSVTQGETAEFTLDLIASQGYAEPVTFTLLGSPPATVAFSSNPIVPPGDSHLSITTTIATTPGIYPMITVAESELLSVTAEIDLVVMSQQPSSYTIGVSPTLNTIAPGHEVTYTVAVTGSGSFQELVTLSALGLPESVGITWSVNPIVPGTEVVLTCAVLSDSPQGEYLFVIAGVNGGSPVAVNARLIIDYPYKIYIPLAMR